MAKKRRKTLEDAPQQSTMFRGQVPVMPEGYYSGDKPNPNLRAFVEVHLKEHPYDPETDDYDVPAFDKPIQTTKATAIYNMHTYWSKKPHDAIREYIRHYTEPGDLVLDPFSGSGGTALAALMEGRRAVAIDRSPAATFITKNYCTPVDVGELQEVFEDLKREVKQEISWLYETRCDRCGGNATTAYTVYSQVFQCPRCLEKVPLFDCVEAQGHTSQGKPKNTRTCPDCHKRGIIEEISTRTERFGAVPVLVSYLCDSGCRPARSERRHNDAEAQKRKFFKKYDVGKLEEIGAREIPHWYPTHRMMHAPEGQQRWALLWRPYLGTRSTVADFFRPRNLWALGCIRSKITSLDAPDHVREALLFCLSSGLLNASDMYRYRESGKGGLSMGTLYVGPCFQVMNAWRGYADKVSDILRGYRSLEIRSPDACISTQDACDLGTVCSSSVDYVFTDPPYSWKVQYGESNFIWEAWLGFDTRWHDEEIIVNEVRGKTEADWADMMRRAMAECYRVLKPGRWLSLCYHDTSEGTWALVQDIMAEVGFVIDRSDAALFIDTGQKAWKQIVADKVNKRDLVVNYRRPKPGEARSTLAITGKEDDATFAEKVRAIIRGNLEAHPGATKDRVYDEVVSCMVRSGQMEPHDFDLLLAQVAEPVAEPTRKGPEASRWYLKETELDVADAAESAKEDAAAERVTACMKKYLKANPGEEGVHYSNLFEHYVYTVSDKPRRPLAEWLLDYFYKTESGTYRLPADEEEERLRAEGRQKGTNRRVKRYLALLDQAASIPNKERPNDATLAEWIRHCKRGGLYEQGKLLYEKGGLNTDNLSEESMVNVEEDYQVCVRSMTREAASPAKKKVKRGRRKKSGAKK